MQSQSKKYWYLCHGTNSTGRKYPLALNIDGNQVFHSQQNENIALEIQKSKKNITLLIAQNHLQDWDNKVIQEQGFKV